MRMEPNELKEGYTAEEKKTNEPVHDDPDPIEVRANHFAAWIFQWVQTKRSDQVHLKPETVERSS